MKISSLMVNGSEYEIQDLELTGRVDELESKQPAVYTAGNTYVKGQLVSHNNVIYMVKVNSTNTEPSSVNTDYRLLLEGKYKVTTKNTINDIVLEIYSNDADYTEDDILTIQCGFSKSLGYFVSIIRNDEISIGYFSSFNIEDFSPLCKLTKLSNGRNLYAYIDVQKLEATTTFYTSIYTGQLSDITKCPRIWSYINCNEKITEMLSDKTEVFGTQVVFVPNKFIKYNGVETNYNNTSAVIVGASDYHTISPYIEYYYTGRFYRDVTPYAFYDKNKKFISAETSEDTTTPIEYENHKVENIPQNAKYIRFSCYYSNNKRWARVSVRSLANPLKWLGKKWVVFGDSITEYNSRTSLHYFDYIAENTGIEILNYGVSGSGYKELASTNKAFYQRILSLENVDFDVITIFGSGNDTRAGSIGDPRDTGTDTICGCMNTTLDNLFSIKPTAIVGIVTPILWHNRAATDTNQFMVQYSNALVEICRLRAIPCLDLSKSSLIRPNDTTFRELCFSKDNEGSSVHPNELGHKILSPRFYNFIESLII